MLKIKVKKGNINQALKNLKNKVFKTKMLNDIRERKDYTKKSVKRRAEINKAKHIQKLKDED
jgi:small subunit ribosomal protein S21